MEFVFSIVYPGGGSIIEKYALGLYLVYPGEGSVEKYAWSLYFLELFSM
jgi:hypothetical protein